MSARIGNSLNSILFMFVTHYVSYARRFCERLAQAQSLFAELACSSELDVLHVDLCALAAGQKGGASAMALICAPLSSMWSASP